MNKFLNLKNGKLSINTYRLPEATLTTQDDLYKSYKTETEECLTASIENKLILVKNGDTWVAGFTGLTGSEDFVFEEEGYNIIAKNADEAAEYASRQIWGFDIDETSVQVND